MKKQMLIVAGLALAASVALTPLALAQTVPTVPTCSQALDQLAAARQLPNGDVATKQTALDLLKLLQVQLDKNVVTAQKNLDAFPANGTPADLAVLQGKLNDAKAAAAAGQAKITVATAALVADQKLANDRAAAITNGQAAVDKACKGADGSVIPTPQVPTTAPSVTVVVPNSINTGRA